MKISQLIRTSSVVQRITYKRKWWYYGLVCLAICAQQNKKLLEFFVRDSDYELQKKRQDFNKARYKLFPYQTLQPLPQSKNTYEKHIPSKYPPIKSKCFQTATPPLNANVLILLCFRRIQTLPSNCWSKLKRKLPVKLYIQISTNLSIKLFIHRTQLHSLHYAPMKWKWYCPLKDPTLYTCSHKIQMFPPYFAPTKYKCFHFTAHPPNKIPSIHLCTHPIQNFHRN